MAKKPNTKPKKRGNPMLGKAQKACKGKKGKNYTACVKRQSKKKK